MESKAQTIERLKQIRNIGPRMAEKLYRAGLYSLEDLKRYGTEDVYIKVDESGGFCETHHAAYMYAIEAAIIGCAWQDVPKSRKEELKEFAKRLRESS